MIQRNLQLPSKLVVFNFFFFSWVFAFSSEISEDFVIMHLYVENFKKKWTFFFFFCYHMLLLETRKREKKWKKLSFEPQGNQI